MAVSSALVRVQNLPQMDCPGLVMDSGSLCRPQSVLVEVWLPGLPGASLPAHCQLRIHPHTAFDLPKADVPGLAATAPSLARARSVGVRASLRRM